MTVRPSQPTLAARGLNKYYGNYHAVRGVDFDVREGELYTLLGPSGCGKSTTLRCVAGLEHIDEGEIAIAGTVVNSSKAGRCTSRRTDATSAWCSRTTASGPT